MQTRLQKVNKQKCCKEIHQLIFFKKAMKLIILEDLLPAFKDRALETTADFSNP